MSDLLGGLAVGDLSAAALVAIIILMILTGRLVTRRQLEDVQTDRDHWRTAADEWQQVATRHGMTLERLVVLAETSNEALTKIQSAIPAARSGQGPT